MPPARSSGNVPAGRLAELPARGLAEHRQRRPGFGDQLEPGQRRAPSRRGTSYQQMSRCAPSSVAVIVERVRTFELRPSAPTTGPPATGAAPLPGCTRRRHAPGRSTVGVAQQRGDPRAHLDPEAGEPRGPLDHERQEAALRHQRVVRVGGARPPVVGKAVGAGGGAPHERVGGAVRDLREQRLRQPERVESSSTGGASASPRNRRSNPAATPAASPQHRRGPAGTPAPPRPARHRRPRTPWWPPSSQFHAIRACPSRRGVRAAGASACRRGTATGGTRGHIPRHRRTPPGRGDSAPRCAPARGRGRSGG